MTSTGQIVQQLASHRDELLALFREALAETLFSNRSFIRPADLRRITASSVDVFFTFLDSQDTTAARQDGVRRANEGLGEQAVLRLGTAMRQFCHAYVEAGLLQQGLAVIDAYTNSFLEGFIDARGALILNEQERIRAALQRTLTRYTVQLQTAAEIAHTTSSVLDPDTLLAFTVDLIRERFGFHYVGLFLIGDLGKQAILHAGSGEIGHEMLPHGQRLEVGDGSTVGACIARGQAHILSEVDAARVQGDETLLPGTRSAMVLPLVARGQVIGAMTIQSSREAIFEDQDMAGLQTLAGQLSNAIENARLYAAAQQEIAERRRAEAALAYLNRRLAALLEVAVGMETTSRPNELPERLVGALAHRLNYDLVFLCKLENGTPELQWSATRNGRTLHQLLGHAELGEDGKFCERTLARRVLQTGQSVFVPDVHQDSSYRGLPMIRSEICCSLQDASGLIGLLDIGSCTPLSEADFAVVQAGARLAATALTNAQLYEQIQHQAAELEERVAQRTAELAAVNRELEAFAYSVSHDLRAPLRSMDGFSQALLEDYSDKLDQDGQDYLRRVRTASQRMGELIDDLLKLSRITRGEVHREVVDLSALARAIVADLQQRDPERQVEWIIATNLWASGDPRLLRVVLENLLDNAWKFTSRHPCARIELGARQIDGQIAYFVRDDGAGFDIAYTERLFSPFQRLHATTEFEGNGIGLATVQRIVSRHGGRIWAEGGVEQGATFYFTLDHSLWQTTDSGEGG